MLINKRFVVPVMTRSKAVAILLAVFFGFFTWIYTWKNDAWKFWVSLGVTIGFLLLIMFFGVLGFVFNEAFIIIAVILYILSILVSIGLWIWAIVDQSAKSESYYTRY